MITKRGNIGVNLPNATHAEVVQELLTFGPGVRVERIHSEGQSSPANFWYDQETDEWVMVVQGGAELEFDDPAGMERLSPGDWLFIPAHRRHRVKSTLLGTVWLAIHAPAAQ